MKKVSVLIPAYRPQFLRAAIASAVAQTWENKEIIVSDDCPTSDVYDVCAEFARMVTYVRNPAPGDGGRNNMINLCRLATGDYLKFLFDDDMLHPFCTKRMMDALSAFASFSPSFAFSPRRVINETDDYLETIDHFGHREETLVGKDTLIRFMATKLINPIGELTTVLFEREAIFDPSGELSIGAIDNEPLWGLGDVAVFVQLLERGPAVFVPEILSFFRKHSGSNSNPEQNRNWPLLITDWKHVIDHARRNGLLDEVQCGMAYQNLLHHLECWKLHYPTHASIFDEKKAALQNEINSCPSLPQRGSFLRGLFSRSKQNGY